jgi:hypothetical protein
MMIRLHGNAAQTTLRIPKNQLKRLAELETTDDDSDNTAAVTGGFSRTQTIVSGAFLSLALVFGGMWFGRSGVSATKAGKTVIILTAIGLAGSAASFVFANAGPPPALRNITTNLFDKKSFQYWNYVTGPVKLETTTGSMIELEVPDPPASDAKGE